MKTITKYDYDNQAWTQDGRYISCEHPDSMNCQCYGKLHAGELVAIDAGKVAGYNK